MRIVGGALGGRRFPGPPSDLTRPTSERVREALASALMARGAIEGARVLDLFCGTGALAFEALSRGAAEATLVDHHARVVKVAGKSAAALGLSERCHVLRLDLLRDLEPVVRALRPKGPFDLVFVDPPYAQIGLVMPMLDALADASLFAPEATVVVEHAKQQAPSECRRLARLADYRYGDTGVRLLSVLQEATVGAQERPEPARD